MALITNPFKELKDEDKRNSERSKIFTVRLNSKEYAMLQEMKVVVRTNKNSRALKRCAIIGMRVLHNTFGKELIEELFKKNA